MPAAIKTHCKNGHELSPRNIYSRKNKQDSPQCKRCRYLATRRHRLEKQRISGRLRKPNHCKNGHELSADNVSIRTSGLSVCKICQREERLRFEQKHRISAQALRLLIRRLKNGEVFCHILRYRAKKYVAELGIPGVTKASWRLLKKERPVLHAMVKKLADKNSPVFNKRTECPRGHPFDDQNLITMPDGHRICRTCREDGVRRRTHNPDLPEDVLRQVLFRLHEGATYAEFNWILQTRLRAFGRKNPKVGRVMDKLDEKNRLSARNARASHRADRMTDADMKRVSSSGRAGAIVKFRRFIVDR